MARRRGREAAALLRRRLEGRPTARRLFAALVEALRELGYEPKAAAGTVRLANCPFHALAVVDREAVCHMNQELLSGLVTGLPECALRAARDTEAGCCVVLRPRLAARRLTTPVPAD